MKSSLGNFRTELLLLWFLHQSLQVKMRGNSFPWLKLLLVLSVFAAGFVAHDIRSNGSVAGQPRLPHPPPQHLPWASGWPPPLPLWCYRVQHGQVSAELRSHRRVPAGLEQSDRLLQAGLQVRLLGVQAMKTKICWISVTLAPEWRWSHSLRLVSMVTVCLLLQLAGEEHSSLLLRVRSGSGSDHPSGGRTESSGRRARLWESLPAAPVAQRDGAARHRLGKPPPTRRCTRSASRRSHPADALTFRWTPTPPTACSSCWRTSGSCCSTSSRTSCCRRRRSCWSCCSERGAACRTPASQCLARNVFASHPDALLSHSPWMHHLMHRNVKRFSCVFTVGRCPCRACRTTPCPSPIQHGSCCSTPPPPSRRGLRSCWPAPDDRRRHVTLTSTHQQDRLNSDKVSSLHFGSVWSSKDFFLFYL